MAETFYKIVYPEVRNVSESKMRSWASDAIANGEIEGPITLSTSELVDQMNDAGLITSSIEYNFDADESMDGDHESALASCGWGMDEDYGYYGEDEW